MGAALLHDQYGKTVFNVAFPSGFQSHGPSIRINYGKGGHARIDGVLNLDIAVEIESRASKQVRGALVDLLSHTARRKLLVLLPVHMANILTTAEQCRHVLGTYLVPNDFHVIIFSGTGVKPQQNEDVALLKKELKGRGWT